MIKIAQNRHGVYYLEKTVWKDIQYLIPSADGNLILAAFAKNRRFLTEHDLTILMHSAELLPVSFLPAQLTPADLSKTKNSASSHQPTTRLDEETSTSIPINQDKLDLLKIKLPPLRDWQKKAYIAWFAAKRVGVVEAATGTGKTRLALEAIADMLARGGRVLVLTTGIGIQQQWLVTLQHFFCEHARIGRFDNKQHDSFIGHDIIVATVHSAARHPVGGIGTDGLTLLVADEVHHLGAPSLSNALSERFVARLSLTATFSRNDSGLELFLKPYFKVVCYRYTLAEATAEGVVAPYELQYLAIPISEEDLCTYRNLNYRMSEARRTILANEDDGDDDSLYFSEFMEKLARLSHDDHNPLRYTAIEYLACFAERRRLLAEHSSKLLALACLHPEIAGSEKCLVFCMTTEGAEAASRHLLADGFNSLCIHSGIKPADRQETMARFARGSAKILCAPLVLDEGIDLPAADMAIIMAANRSERQFIQRAGRILRRKADGHPARLCILYLENTLEAPGPDILQSCYGPIHAGAHKLRWRKLVKRTLVDADLEPPTQPDETNTAPECEEPVIPQPAAAEISEQHAHKKTAAPGNLVTLSQLTAWLDSRHIPYENNRALGGGIWVYAAQCSLSPHIPELERLGVSVRPYPAGRKRRPGPQWELDGEKRLRPE